MNTMTVIYILAMLLLVSVCGYALVVIKEKIYLTKNIILLEKKSVTETHLNEADIKEFMLDGDKYKTGDEVKVMFVDRKKVSGIIIGAIKKENQILIVTHDDQIKKFSIGVIKRIRVVSRYGKFF
ncbi:hypothetical protein PV797_07875 [Clostridiaceae bacterium M8S5]|nr:hypothetical protein PV797_07875 [Clostridiaceae bacterium M8S5]